MDGSHPGAVITPAFVAELVAARIPAWADLPVRPVAHQGSDNRTFRLGGELSVRLPSAAAYADQIRLEHRWLPALAPHLPQPIPEPLVLVEPCDRFPLPWSVRRWLPGEPPVGPQAVHLIGLAADLGAFLVDLRGVRATGGPQPGAHNFGRGGPLRLYDREIRLAVSALGAAIDGSKALRVWAAALATEWNDLPVWVHGDMTPSNLLARDGRLCGVIDFGGSAVGDPSCDLAVAWTAFDGPSRRAFEEAVGVDGRTWARGRGWALWKMLITLAEGAAQAETARQRFAWRCPVPELVDDLLDDVLDDDR